MNRKLILLGVIFTFLLSGCGDECSSYSDFSCDEIQKAEYNVMFNFPNDDKSYDLGHVTGLSACGSLAYSYAAQKNVDGQKWGYVCCMEAKGSSCYQKHR